MIKFRKLYQPLTEGAYDFCIIGYSKQPWLMKTQEQLPFNADWSATPTRVEYVAQYRKRLKIDLWLFVLAWEWKTKEITK